MRNRILALLCSALILTAPSLEAKTLNKNNAAAQKTVKKPRNTTKGIAHSSVAKKPGRPSKQNLSKNSRSHTVLQKKTKKLAAPIRRGKSVASKNRPYRVAKKTDAVGQRTAIVNKAIAHARSQAKIHPASTLSSTLYSPAIQSASALVIHQHSGQIIYEKNAKHIAPIASISKLMTAMVVLDAQLAMNEYLTVTEEDIDRIKGTSSRLSIGTKLTRAEMLLLTLMSSENRAASALSRHYPGGQTAFIEAMNQKAQKLGMKNTRFYEPTGLSSRNISTPHELSLMVSAAHVYPEIQQFTTSLQYNFVSNLTGAQLTFRNTNPLTRSNDWNIGISKTGYINEAGKCLVMQTIINKLPVVIVLLDSIGNQTRIADAQRIKKWMELNPIVSLNAG